MKYNIYEIIEDFENGTISRGVAYQFISKAKKEIEQALKDLNIEGKSDEIQEVVK